MTFADFIGHYIAFPGVALFGLFSFFIVIVIHFILLLISNIVYPQKMPKNNHPKSQSLNSSLQTYQQNRIKYFLDITERYYELIFSATSILFFIGIYFWITLDYFQLLSNNRELWNQYDDFLLLGFIIISILLNTLFDHIFVPLKHIKKEILSTLRMAGMVYMLIIFAYIKFIYEDNNYDTIIIYFLTLVIGRFVYFDASIKDFFISTKNLFNTLPILLLVLLSTIFLALYGFGTKYLLRSNGVIMSLFIAHFFVVLEIFIISRSKIFLRILSPKKNKKML